MADQQETTDTEATTRVVVGVDGSKQSETALLWGRYFAQLMKAHLCPVMAWVPIVEWAPVVPVDMTQDWNSRRHAEDLLAATITRVFGDDPGVPVDSDIHEGSPAKVLIEASQGAAVIVVASRGRGGFRGLLLGSVSGHVSSHAQCPVFIVHGDKGPPN